MADVSFSNFLVDELRRLGPLYQLLRRPNDLSRTLLLTAASMLGGSNPQLGIARRKVRLSSLLREGKVQGRVILPSQPIPPIPDGSLRARTGWDLAQFFPWPIFWAHVRDARLVSQSHGLVMADKAIAVESVWGEYYSKQDPALNYLTLPTAVRLEGNWTSVVNRHVNGFYHWFLDSLPRLACLDEFPSDTRVLVPKPLHRYQRESLEIMGLTGDRIYPTADLHLVAEHYYFSNFTAMTGVSNPYAVSFLRDRFGHCFVGTDHPTLKIFVVRKGKTRGLLNEVAVAKYLERDGWLVADMEQFSMIEQIRLFSSAEAIVAVHGAALTNLLWCRPGTKVLEICADRFVNGCYETIAELLNLDHRHVLLPSDHSFRVTLPMLMLESHRDWLNDGLKKAPVDVVLPYTNDGYRSTHD